jgi:hypothetical protein
MIPGLYVRDLYTVPFPVFSSLKKGRNINVAKEASEKENTH